MGGKLEKGSSFSSCTCSSKQRRLNDDYASRPRRKQHLYLALDDWNGGYSIHKLDADDILDQEPAAAGGGEHKLPEPSAVQIASPVRSPMAFAALGANIFVATNPRSDGDRAPPTLVYDTMTSALTVGPRVPDKLQDMSAAMAVGETLYALTSVPFHESSSLQALSSSSLQALSSSSLQALSWAPTAVPDREPWDPAMEWSWNTVPSPRPPPYDGIDVVTYALHPDGRTVFMSTGISTHSLDTGNGVWKDLGGWVLPFRGKAYSDAKLDAWGGLHREEDGYVCWCPVASRSTATTRAPECRMLMEKLVRRKEEDPKHWSCLRGIGTSLTFMGDSRFALVENILRSDDFDDGSVLHVTLFGLKYDHKGEQQTKGPSATRS